MRHFTKSKRFGRSSAQHNTIMKNLLRSLLIEKKLVTTTSRAKLLKTYADRVLSKSSDSEYVKNKAVLRHIYAADIPTLLEVVNTYKDKKGGYTQIIKIFNQRKDASEMSLIKLV